MCKPTSRRLFLTLVLGTLGATGAAGRGQDPAPSTFPPPEPVAEVTLGPTLKTHPLQRTPQGFVDQTNKKATFNEKWIDASVLPRDKQGIWVLDFAFKPIRIMTIQDGKGRRDVHYMYYQVINRTGKARMLVPQFTLVTDTGKRIEEAVLPAAVKLIQMREDASIRDLYGAVDIMGMIPPSNRQGVEDAVFGVAIWDGVDPRADKLTVFVRGLSDGYRQDTPAEAGAKPVVRYKALQIDYIRRGDEHELKERDITLAEPPYDWTYR